MKKAIKTLFQPQSFKITLMVVFAWCCLSVPTAEAQDIVMGFTSKDTTSTAVKLDPCNGDVTSGSRKFTDEGGNDGNYTDPDIPHFRRDTVEICPVDQWHRVKVVFTDFDLAAGDTLYAYDGNRDTVRNNATVINATAPSNIKAPGIGIGSGSGVGVSKFAVRPDVANAGAGWIDANCDPRINPSGCLTFVFETNGDNGKGKGWEAWVDCEKRDIEIKDVTISDATLTCTQTTANISISSPKLEVCGSTIPGPGNVFLARIKNEQGEIVLDTTLSENGALVTAPDWISLDFAIGQYSVEYKWTGDTTKTLTKLFSVQAPSLVCNDEVEAPLGAACAIQFAPDDLLESACDTISGFMYYNITITLGSGKDQKVLMTSNHSNGNPVVYPTITKKDINDSKVDICGGTATVKIERIYYALGAPTGAWPTDPVGFSGVKNASCETTIKFSDLSRPVINVTSLPDTLVACDTTGLAKILGVTASDNCSDNLTPSYTVRYEENDPCFANLGSRDTTKAIITFTATDACGNTATPVVREVTMIRPNPEMIAKTGDVTVECTKDTVIVTPGLKIGTWVNNAFQVKDTVRLSTTEYICGYILVSSDEDIPSTDCGRKLYRYYDLLDWCDAAGGDGGGAVRVDTTYVEYTDKTAPKITNDSIASVTTSFGRAFAVIASADIELGAFDCTYDITKYGGPNATDNCDATPTVSLDSIFRIEDGVQWPVATDLHTKLDCDSFYLRWVAADNCHEQLENDTVYQIVEIKDVTKPSAVCIDRLTVSVPTDEGARVNLTEIDAGSTDACGIKSKEVKRQDSSTWSDHVIITCEDVHEEVIVELRITDNKDNVNICWLTITAEDKIPPVCENLADASITCKEIHTGELGASTDADGDGTMEDSEWKPLTGDLMEVYNTRFGAPNCQDNLTCGNLVIEQEYQLIETDCGALTARRRYRANDWKPNSSTWAEQKITVTYVPEWTLKFPADIDLTCADGTIPVAPKAEDIIDNGSCDLWALEVTDETFEVGDGVCMKVERTYEAINWCVYTAGAAGTNVAHNAAGASVSYEGNETVGRYTYTQVIKLYVTEAPTVTINDVNTCIVGVGDAVPFNEEDQTPGTFAYECDTIRTFSASATNCVGTALSDFEWKFYVDGTLTDSGKGGSFDKVVTPKVKYKVEFWASDGCGNSAGETREFEFWDCKKPTPFVLNGIAVELGQGGSVDVWAADLNAKSFDNCTDQDKLEMYIGIGEPNAGPTTIEGVRALGSNITLTCANVGTQSVSFYVVDAEGNWDVVGTYVLVQANQVDCSGVEAGGMVAGHIVNPNGENVEQVSVSVSGAMQEGMTTGADGVFQFDLNTGADYTVTPVKDMNPLNGVSTFDLVLISKHILGITPFDSPYKYIAADVNKSGTITAFDMVQLRQLILNIKTEFTNNDSWRFVDAKHDFSASTENAAAQDFAEFMTISQLASNMMDVDFVGVKIGDVNGNAAANSLLGAETRNTNGTLNFDVTDRFVQAGETVTVEFKSADIAAAQGYQFTLDFAGLEFDKLEEGVAKAANFNTNLAQRGVIATSWNGEATADDVLFAMTFNATASGLLSDLITVSSELTMAEAYNTDGELLDVNIQFSTNPVVSGFELGQNIPNPFNAETIIGFNLPEAGTARLTVMNVQGKVLKEIKGDYAKGYNTIVLKASELATGVLHYQLESADQVATKKMIIIE